jgi:hypothetical protein
MVRADPSKRFDIFSTQPMFNMTLRMAGLDNKTGASLYQPDLI